MSLETEPFAFYPELLLFTGMYSFYPNLFHFTVGVGYTPCKGKSVSIVLLVVYAFALTGRHKPPIINPGCRFACPGLGACWAFSPLQSNRLNHFL